MTENFASRPAYAEADNGDYNTAVSMLFRWWGLFEAPAGVDISPFYADLFADDVHIDLPDGGVDITGVDAIQATMAALPAGIRRSHAINHDDIQVTALGDGLYRLQANYTYQLETDGKLVSGHSHCDNILRKVAPARMVYTRVSGGLGDTFGRPEFVDSYVENRIKAVLIQWQAVMDTLNGDAAPLEELVMPRLEFHGLISSKQDQSDGRAETVTDFKEMKGILAGTDGSEDTIIRGFEGVQEWFATGPALLKSNIHRFETIAITPLPDNRFETTACFGWYAETLSGVPIELHQPLTWIIVERGEKYMRLEALRPHD
ncbi:MAG: hypothetical protein JNM03_15560 [Sphingopyxis sp.]|uniref:hypothetical protein n=1 Tax=Sphingopyxis sp. TaxID=1908224 RepID=UPI001A48F30D|nr:hypothetical protein [Sphingopyxis sp.]MBL9071399.1 hypothetical protein [Sphingopyxis sp.]